MFEAKVMNELLARHGETLKRLGEVEDLLCSTFHGMNEPVRALVLSVASGEPLLLLGPPGAGKSRLIRVFCEIVGILPRAGERAPVRGGQYFEYLLTPFTEPGELFGFYDVARFQDKSELVRLADGKLQKARVVFLDEIFNGSSAILNSLLAILNERIFHDGTGPEPMRVELECLFGASNEAPSAQHLRAIYDRFVLRCRIENIAAQPLEKPGGRAEALERLLERGWAETYGDLERGEPARHTTLLDDLAALRTEIATRTTTGELRARMNREQAENLALTVSLLQREELVLSNRRLVKMSYTMLVHALYRAAIEDHEPVVGAPEWSLLRRFFLDRHDPELEVRLEQQLGEMGHPDA